MTLDIKKKWNAIYTNSTDSQPQPCEVLKACSHLLPSCGRALDLACGLGGNALFLAEHGLDTLALDISEVAIRNLDKTTHQLSLPLTATEQDLHAYSWQPKQFDVIVVSRFLERKFTKSIMAALNPEGLLFYQTFITEKVADVGPSNPDYLLAENELLEMFRSLKILFYREEGSVGNIGHGFRNEAMLVGQKRN